VRDADGYRSRAWPTYINSQIASSWWVSIGKIEIQA
jgi:hypothetical protein